MNQVLGKNSGSPDLGLLYYSTPVTRSGNVEGGTATAVNYAASLGIPTLNLIDEPSLEEVLNWVKGLTQVQQVITTHIRRIYANFGRRPVGF